MKKTVGKEEWVGMFREIGLDEPAMKKWHRVFESKYPDGHQSFLEWLGVPPVEIEKIRAASRG